MKKQLIIILCIVIIVPIAIIGFLANKTAIDILSDNLTENTNNVTIQLTDGFDKVFEGYNNSLVMLRNNKKLKNTFNTPENEILDIFRNYESGHDDVTAAYIGTTDGKMYFLKSENLPSDFDPRKRPWYKNAKDLKKPVWTNPYTDASSGNTIVTGSISVYNNNEFIGVIGFNINITSLAQELSNQKIGADGYAVLVGKDKKIIVHPDESLIGKPSPVQKIADAMEEKEEGGVTYNYKGKEKYIYFKKMETTGW